MLQATENYALVEIEKKFQDSFGDIVIDTSWLPEEHATLEGIVITAPLRRGNNNLRKVVGYVSPGDRIFFSYGVVFDYIAQPDNDTPVYKNLVLYEGKEYWRVELGEMFCKIASAEVVMITDNVLIRPVSKETGYILGAPPGFKKGDLVCFESKYVQQYNIMGSNLYILPSRKLLAFSR